MPHDVHRKSTILLSLSLIVIGVAMFVRALDAGGGPLSIGVLLGVLFAAAGGGRLWIAWRQP